MPVVVASPLPLTDEQRSELSAMARSSSLPHRQVVQARALLLAGEGLANEEIARRCETTTDSVRRWRARFAEQGTAGVGVIAPGRGRKPTVRVELAAAVVEATLTEIPPGDEPQWSTRLMAERFGIGKDTVARIWRARGIRPHRVETFKVSTDPAFEDKLTDIVGLYLDPPKRAVVFCVDEKTQVQALDRTQPSLPLTPGRAATMTHDYRRHGTTNLYAALDVATGRVLTLCQPRHRHREFLAFLKMVNASVPRGRDVHVIVDNSSTHTHPIVRSWLARHRRVHLHFTPTSSSWLNLVELWFRQITNRRLRRAAFRSVHELIDAIDDWTDHWNDQAAPFAWTTTAEEILDKVRPASEGSLDKLGTPLVVTAGDPPERRRTEEFLSSLPEGRLAGAQTHALPGAPAREILRVAKEVEADLIVVGDKGMHGARRVLGSVANDVSHGAACSVLVVKTT